MIAFNVDPLFNNAVDGLMYIRIADLPESTVKTGDGRIPGRTRAQTRRERRTTVTNHNQNIMNYYFEVFKKYADFKGRARRKEYWMFMLFHIIIMYALLFWHDGSAVFDVLVLNLYFWFIGSIMGGGCAQDA